MYPAAQDSGQMRNKRHICSTHYVLYTYIVRRYSTQKDLQKYSTVIAAVKVHSNENLGGMRRWQMLRSSFGLRRSRTILHLNKMFSCKSLISFSLSACYSKVYMWLFYNRQCTAIYLVLFPCLKFVLFLVTATTGEKMEQPESQNDRNDETTQKQERPGRWNDHKVGKTGMLKRPKSRNDRNAETTIKQERPECWNDHKAGTTGMLKRP